MLFLGYIATAVASYLLGSIPTGFLVARARGVDIRTVGSKNMGATNVFRVLGKAPGIFVLLVDAAKGWLACKIVAKFALQWITKENAGGAAEHFEILAGFCAVLGHNFTCWLYFKGGKGIATSAGVLLALFPWALLVVLGIFIVVLAVSRYVSLASVMAAFWLPLCVHLFHYSAEKFWVSLVMAALAILKHKPNIRRLIAGTEKRLGDKPAGAAAKENPTK